LGNFEPTIKHNQCWAGAFFSQLENRWSKFLVRKNQTRIKIKPEPNLIFGSGSGTSTGLKLDPVLDPDSVGTGIRIGIFENHFLIFFGGKND